MLCSNALVMARPLKLSMAAGQDGREGGHSFPQLSLVFHCLRRKLLMWTSQPWMLPDSWQSTSDILDGNFWGRDKGHCPVGLCKHKSSAELCTMPALLRWASGPSRVQTDRQTGTEPQDLLALPTSRCLLQTSRTTSVARRARTTGLFLLKLKRRTVTGSPLSQRQCKQVRGPPHTLESLP